jgi:hypothetical protein
MSKSEEVKKHVGKLKSRVTHLTESMRRISIFEGMNDGKMLSDTTKRLKVAEINLSQYIKENIEYVL